MVSSNVEVWNFQKEIRSYRCLHRQICVSLSDRLVRTMVGLGLYRILPSMHHVRPKPDRPPLGTVSGLDDLRMELVSRMMMGHQPRKVDAWAGDDVRSRHHRDRSMGRISKGCPTAHPSPCTAYLLLDIHRDSGFQPSPRSGEKNWIQPQSKHHPLDRFSPKLENRGPRPEGIGLTFHSLSIHTVSRTDQDSRVRKARYRKEDDSRTHLGTDSMRRGNRLGLDCLAIARGMNNRRTILGTS